MVSQKSLDARKLEVIVTSLAEAVDAEKGGADRLEMLRDLETGGLTPDLAEVRAVLTSVAIPVRVMVRENAGMLLGGPPELELLEAQASAFSLLPIDGLVLGWVSSEGELDIAALEAVLAVAPMCAATFHRAFEQLADPYEGLRKLKNFPQIDRILTSGGPGSWPERKRRLLAWSEAAAPEIQLVVGGGLSNGQVTELMTDAAFSEIHVGRIARKPAKNDGIVDRELVAALKSRWA